MLTNNSLLRLLSILFIFVIFFNTELKAQCIKEYDFNNKNQITKIKITIDKNRKWIKSLSRRLVRKGAFESKKNIEAKY